MDYAKTRPKVVWMFSGQGSQYFRMGKKFYQNHEIFKYWMDKLDALAEPYVNRSIIELLYEEEHRVEELFDQTIYTHPALFMIQFALAKTLLEAEDIPKPDYLLGSSLGEFVCAALAQVESVENLLFDLIRQAGLLEAHCQSGGMLAVIDDIKLYPEIHRLFPHCELAGINFDRCFVVSGLKNELDVLAQYLKGQDVTFQILPVQVAFHSSQLDAVKQHLMHIFNCREYQQPQIPIITSALNHPDSSGHVDMDHHLIQAKDIYATEYHATRLWNIIRSPINMRDCIKIFNTQHPNTVYWDLGPAGNMAGYIKYILDQPDKTVTIMTPFGDEWENFNRIKRS